MGQNRIENRLSRLATLIEGWNKCGSVPRIERDLALEELRHIYAEVLDYEPAEVEPLEPNNDKPVAEAVMAVAPVVVAEVDAVVEPEETIEDIAEDVGEAFDDALDIDALLGLSGDDKIVEPEPEVKESVAEVVEVVEAAEPEAVQPEAAEPEAVADVVTPAEAPATEAAPSSGLFAIEDIPVRSKSGRKMISLYNAAQVSEPKVEAERVETPVVESKTERELRAVNVVEESASDSKRLGDVLSSGVTVLADKMAAEETATPAFNRITDIRKAIGLNDKFLMINDLFAGDVSKYEDTIDTLNEFEDLDECMIYIVENFSWNPDSEGAKLLVSLIERKLA